MTPDDSLLLAVDSEEPGEWRRDLYWSVRCRCGHGHVEHRHDLKQSSPCSRGGCGCQHLRPGAIIFQEHRTVVGTLVQPGETA